MRMLIRFLQGRWWRWMRGGSRFFFSIWRGHEGTVYHVTMSRTCQGSGTMSLFRRWQLSHFGEREGMRFEKEDFGVQAMLETWDHWDPSGWFQWKISSSIHVRQEKHISLKTSFKNSWRSHLFFNGGQFVVGSCGPPRWICWYLASSPLRGCVLHKESV